MHKSSSCSGNVLFLILIAVALFAALSYVVTNSTRSGPGSLSNDKMEMAISQLLQNGIGASTAVTRMTMSKFKPEQLDFWWKGNPVGAVFGKDGGAAELDPPEMLRVMASGSFIYYYITPATSPTSIKDVGTTAPDVFMYMLLSLTPETERFCTMLNKRLGITGVPGSASGPVWIDAAPGKPVACVRNYNDFYVFYYTLLEL